MDKKEYYREYYKKNKRKYLQSIRKYQKSEKGKKKIKEYLKKYYQSEQFKKKNKERYKKNRSSPTWSVNERLRLYQFKALNNCNNLAGRKFINRKEIIKHLRPFPKEMQQYEIDHIIPISNFDLTKKEDIIKAFSPENHQWLQKWENRIKRDMNNKKYKELMKESIDRIENFHTKLH